MAYNYEYPYTDPSRYNADWLLKSMQDLGIKVEDIEKEFAEVLDKIKRITDSQTLYINVTNPPEPYAPMVGDGNTDNTQAFQALANIENVVLFFPAGIYATKPVEVHNDIVGAGTNAEILRLNDGTEFPTITMSDGHSICNIAINGNRDAQSEQNSGLYLTTNNLVDNIKIRRCYTGMIIGGNQNLVSCEVIESNHSVELEGNRNLLLLVEDGHKTIDSGIMNNIYSNFRSKIGVNDYNLSDTGNYAMDIDGAKSENIGGNNTIMIGGNVSKRVNGTETETTDGNREINAKRLKINTEDFLQYGEVLSEDSDKFIDMLDENGANYELLVRDSENPYAHKSDVQEIISQPITLHFLESGTTKPNGACVIVELENGVILMDFGTSDGGPRIANYLANTGLTNIIGIVVSHYHADHVLGADAILGDSRLSFSGNMYLPHNQITFDSYIGDYEWINDRKAHFVTLAQNVGMSVVYPTENQEFSYGNNLKLRFNNLTPTYFANYYPYTLNSVNEDTGYTTYNNFSMVTTVETLNKRFVYTADIQDPATKNMVYVVQGANVLTAPHHGLNVTLNPDYINTLTPEVYIVPTGENIWGVDYLTHPDICRCANNGADVFITYAALLTKVTMTIDNIIATCNGKQYEGMTSTIFDYGIALTSLNITDFDDLVDVGVYTVSSANEMRGYQHAPFDYSGGKIRVEMLAGNKTLIQIASTNSSVDIAFAYRRRTSGGSWTAWKSLHSSSYYYKQLTASDINADVTLTSSVGNRLNYVTAQNGYLIYGLDFTANENIPSGTELCSVDLVQYYSSNHGLLYGTNGELYPVQLSCPSNNGHYTLITRKQIPSGTRVYSCGIITALLSTSSV